MPVALLSFNMQSVPTLPSRELPCLGAKPCPQDGHESTRAAMTGAVHVSDESSLQATISGGPLLDSTSPQTVSTITAVDWPDVHPTRS